MMVIARSPKDDVVQMHEYASPACSMHEVDLSYMGYLSETEVSSFLKDLLQHERSAARIFARSSRNVRDTALSKLALDVELMQQTLCDLLQREVSTRVDPRSKGMLPSQRREKPRTVRQRVDFGCSYQQELIRIIEGVLPKIRDASLCAVLKTLLDGHTALVVRIQGELSSERGGAL